VENTLTDTSTGRAEIVHRIKRILVEDLQLNVVPAEIPDDYSLLESGLALDSIVIAELIVQIEDRFGVQFDDRTPEMGLFDNLSVLAAFVERERRAKTAAAGTPPGGASC
jgi:acyl carrier protein